MRGIRGAITIKNDTESEIVAAVRWMVTEMIRHNGVKPEDIGAVIFSAILQRLFRRQGLGRFRGSLRCRFLTRARWR